MNVGVYYKFDLLSYLNRISIKNLELGRAGQSNFEFVSSSWTGKLLELEQLTIIGTTLNNLDFLINNTNLISLSLDDCKLSDISGLQCYSTLKNLNLANNKITNLENISKFTALGGLLSDGKNGVLNLSNNPIYDEYNYLNEDGSQMYEGDKPKKTQNVEELAKLKNSTQNLKQIILMPNGLIKDFSPLENLGWDKETGTFK